MAQLDLTTLSTNLRRLRILKGKTQTELAEASRISRVGYRNIETGSVVPRADSLARIADVLGVRLDDLLLPAQPLRAVRFRAQKKMTSREQVLVEVARWLGDYNEVETLVDDRRAFAFDEVVAKTHALAAGEDRARLAADLARRAVGLTSDHHEDVVSDVCGVLEMHGVKVITPKVASEGFFGLSVAADDGGPAVVVNVWDRISVERWIFTAAHELAHLLLHLSSFDVTKAEENKTEEREADIFASYFLMPDGLFEKAWNDTRGLRLVERVLKVKRIFRVSYRAVLYRIASTGNTTNVWMRFQVEYRGLTGRTLLRADEPQRLRREAFRAPAPRADEPERLDQYDFVKDRLSNLVRRGVESKKISLSRAAEILGTDEETMSEYAASWTSTR